MVFKESEKKKDSEVQITVIIKDNVSLHFKNDSSKRQWDKLATCWVVSSVQEWGLQRKRQESSSMQVWFHSAIA